MDLRYPRMSEKMNQIGWMVMRLFWHLGGERMVGRDGNGSLPKNTKEFRCASLSPYPSRKTIMIIHTRKPRT